MTCLHVYRIFFFSQNDERKKAEFVVSNMGGTEFVMDSYNINYYHVFIVIFWLLPSHLVTSWRLHMLSNPVNSAGA